MSLSPSKSSLPGNERNAATNAAMTARNLPGNTSVLITYESRETTT